MSYRTWCGWTPRSTLTGYFRDQFERVSELQCVGQLLAGVDLPRESQSFSVIHSHSSKPTATFFHDPSLSVLA